VKYSRRCQCRKGCPHLARGIEALQPAERLLQLEPVLAVLMDAAAGYDADSLHYDPDCPIHGERPVSNTECSCKGDPTSALEFILALEVEVRAAKAGRNAPTGRPNTERRSDPRILLAVS
jgi:hypothetical protein